MALIDQLTKDVVKTPLEATTKSEVLRELVQVLADAGRITEVEKAYNALLERESRGSTGLEKGVAVPHAKTDAVKSLTAAIGIAPKGLEFEALDGEPSKLFFLLLAAPDQSGPHIEALSEIAKLTRSQTFCDMLVNARSAEEVVNLLQEE